MEIPREPFTGSSAWQSNDLMRDDSWKRSLSDSEVDELRAAVSATEGGSQTSAVSPAVDTPRLREVVQELTRELEKNRGLALIRNVPVTGYSMPELHTLAGIMGTSFGRLIVQDTSGTLIDHVSDRGKSYNDIRVRGYTTNAELTPHCDSGDLLGLLCVRQAQSGGENQLSSAVTIYNRILEERPEYLECLYRGVHYNIRGNGPPGPWRNITEHRVPVYHFRNGVLSCRFNQKAMKTSQELHGAPRLTETEVAAIDYVANVARRENVQHELRLEAGDMLILNNHWVFHNRSSFQDSTEPDSNRLLMRMWINIEGGRDLSYEFADHYNTGPREGPHVDDAPGGAAVRSN